LLGPEGDRSEVLDTILAARRESYAEAHATLPTDDAPPAALSQRVLEVWRRPMIAVPLGARTYAVELAAEDGLALGRTVAAHARSAVFVVSDRNVEPLWGDALRASLRANGIEAKATIAVPPGEGEKHLGTVEAVLRALVEAGADRDALVVGHGGGVVTDIAGFCAATLLRGVPWVAAPTTLLGMVDAAVGGKTGVDLGAAKNAVGAFHQPKGVVVDMSRAATESPRGFRSGLAEVVKAASIADAALFEALERQVEALRRRERTAAELAAWGALRVKAAIVGRDEHEAGERAVLNFGHTIGHALEMQGGLGRLTHGEAVALGMIAALRVGERLGVTPRGVVERVVGLLDALGLPTNLDAEDLAAALPAVAFDKKRRGGSIRFVLLRAIGATELCWVEPSALAALVSPAATA
jgi:shikimate kinase/3-dehydroquinate synthase